MARDEPPERRQDWQRRVCLSYKSVQSGEESGIFPSPPGRLVVMGDLHGDWNATISAFRAAGLIARRGKGWHWSGANAWVVQLGDQIDRLSRDVDDDEDEASEVRIMTFLDRMNREARRQGGRVISLLGNHEILNVMGNFSYVSRKGILFFGSNPEARRRAFQPGGPMALYMANNRYAVVKIGDSLFVHGAMTPTIAKKYNIAEQNEMVRRYLLGKQVSTQHLFDLLDAPHSIFWSRMYSGETYKGQLTQSRLEMVLQQMGCERMFVGHTPQSEINHAFDGRVWRCDVGMSRAFGRENQRARIQVLEVQPKTKKDHLLVRVWRIRPEVFEEACRIRPCDFDDEDDTK